MKHPLLAVLLLLFFLPNSSKAQKGELTGRLLDDISKEALPYATIAVYSAADTVMVTFRMSDEKGAFRVTGLPLDQQLRTVITMMGFQVYRKEFQLSQESPSFALGVIHMKPSEHLLSEVLIVAETPPVLVRNDTLEFNASSFKTLPTSLVEDLLRKLPGVTVDQQGNIMVNGKLVQKILVDGKEFFGSDPKVATRNLPADVIDKVQVMNDPEALRRDPDLPEMDIPQVINLTFKKGIKKGMFGKLYGGAGTDTRYEGGGILNMFRDTTQVSIIGFSNNLNRAAFDMADVRKIGGFDRSGISTMSMRSDGGYSLNGVSFGGMGQGIEQSSGGGANFNTVTKRGTKVNLQYFYGDSREDLDQVVNSEQFLKSDTLNSRRNRGQNGRSESHRLGGKIEWKLDSLTTLSIAPSMHLSYQLSTQNSFINTYRNHDIQLNQSTNEESINGEGMGFGNTLNFQRNFNKKGRLLTLYSRLNQYASMQDQLNEAENIFYQPDSAVTQLNQLRDTDQNDFEVYNSLAYTEPFHKLVSAVFRLNSEYFSNDNSLATYMADSETGEYVSLVPGLSNGVDRKGWRNYLTAGLKWKIKDVTVQPGIRFTFLNINNNFQTAPDIKQDYFYVFPNLNVNWKQFYLTYNVNLSEPTAVYLQPVLDNTNPLFIAYGNPTLRPAVSNTVNINYRKFDTKKSINYSAFVYGSIRNNAITRARTVDENGVQTIKPVNTDGNWDLSGSGRVMKDFKYDKNKFSIGANMRVFYGRTLVLLNNTQSYSQNWTLTPEVEGRMNLDDKLELSQSFSLNYRRSSYENNAFNNLSINTSTSKSEIVVRLPKKLVWEATFDYWYNSNMAPGLQKSYGRLNAGLTFLFLKNDRAQLKLSVYDLLDQNITAYRYIRENLIEDYQTVALTRYGMLTFTYNIRNFGQKVGGRQNPLFWF
ncbi:outer membrane beta-barrel protein [Pontibacter sp. MBLB2868]|uniref:outer membrane beta-barrel protein n=1 Tax=Pontibacter sp. MBLB2868 TaxID=3451555 RepID=UPI003F750655